MTLLTLVEFVIITIPILKKEKKIIATRYVAIKYRTNNHYNTKITKKIEKKRTKKLTIATRHMAIKYRTNNHNNTKIV